MTKRIKESELVTESVKNKLDSLAEAHGVPTEQLLGHVAPSSKGSKLKLNTIVTIILAASLPAVWFVKDREVKALQKGSADFCEQAIGQSRVIADLNEQIDEFRAMLVKPVESGIDIDGFAARLKPKDWWNRRLGGSGGTRLHRIVTTKKDNKFLFGIADLEVALREGADLNFNRFRVNKNGGWKSGEATGQTPLMQMIAYGRWDMVEYVLTHHMDKIDKSACNFAGKTAADYVLKFGGDDKQQFYALLKD